MGIWRLLLRWGTEKHVQLFMTLCSKRNALTILSTAASVMFSTDRFCENMYNKLGFEYIPNSRPPMQWIGSIVTRPFLLKAFGILRCMAVSFPDRKSIFEAPFRGDLSRTAVVSNVTSERVMPSDLPKSRSDLPLAHHHCESNPVRTASGQARGFSAKPK